MTIKVTSIIIFNIVMGLLFFLSSEAVLFALRGHVVGGANVFIDYSFPASPVGYAPPTITGPLPNFPFFIFSFSLIINIYFLIKNRKANS
jgi:hypothetical protein